MEKIKKLPFFIKGIAIVAIVSVMVVAAAGGLRALEEKQQKPRVIKALTSLMTDAAAEQYRMAAMFEVLESGKIVYSGNGKITDLDENLISEPYRFAAPYIKQTTLDFSLQKDETVRQAEFYLEAALHGLKAVTAEGYLDDTECIVRVPQFHESYLSFSPNNLKQQYEESLLYTVLGDGISLPQNTLTDYVFGGAEKMISEEREALSMNVADSLELAKQLYEKITVTKTEQKEEILWNGTYESCVGYEMVVPTEIVNQFLQDTVWKKTGHTLQLEGEDLTLLVYLNSDKKALKLETEKDILVDGRKVPVAVAFFPKGVENAWDSVLLELEVTWEEVIYGISLICSNEFQESERILHTSLSMTQPYVTELLDMDMIYQPNTGAITFDFACKTPVLSVDGICKMAPLTEALQKPQAETVRIFELGLFDILKFTNGLNWNLFKNQE